MREILTSHRHDAKTPYGLVVGSRWFVVGD
jgi:hypothetical protein